MIRLRQLVLVLLVCLATASTVSAQTLTPAQKATLKAAIVADNTANALYTAGDLAGLAAYENENASPTFYVYRRSVPVADSRLST